MTKGVVTCNLYKRKGSPSVNAEKLGYYISGDEVEIIDVLIGETTDDYYEGTPTWYKLINGIYVWSGGVSMDLDEAVFQKKIKLDYSKTSKDKIDQEKGWDWWYEKYDINKIAEIYTSERVEVTITIVDSGFTFIHKYFNINQISGINWNGDENYQDIIGHGTKVASVVAANGINLKGIAPEVKLFICKYYDFEPDPKQLLYALKRIPDNSDIVIITSGFLRQDIKDDIFEELRNLINNISNSKVIICSCGDDYNHHNNPFERYPASFKQVISVSSVDSMNLISEFSTKSNNINISAPGSLMKVIDGLTKNIVTENGTSFSAPFVAGVVALLKLKKKDIEISKIIDAIQITATKRNPKSLYGNGIINPLKASKLLNQ